MIIRMTFDQHSLVMKNKLLKRIKDSQELLHLKDNKIAQRHDVFKLILVS